MTYADRQLVSFLEQNKIDWPDFRIVNQQTKKTQHRVLNIDSDGHVFYEERFSANLQAPEFDFRKFPFDYQDFWIRIETIEPDTFATLALHEDPDFNSVGVNSSANEAHLETLSGLDRLTGVSPPAEIDWSAFATMGITHVAVHHLRLGKVRDDIAVSTLTAQGWKPTYRSRDTSVYVRSDPGSQPQ